jgi:hypothetical protein
MFGTTCARPHIGWQVDPFGHARETASLMAMMGFDALFFGRLDEADKQNRFKNKEMELVWKASANQGNFVFSIFFLFVIIFCRWLFLSLHKYFPRLLLPTRWLLL